MGAFRFREALFLSLSSIVAALFLQKKRAMLTLEYLKQIIGSARKVEELSHPYEITDLDSQVIESDAGYDGIVELINVRPDADLAIVVLENSESFSFEVNPGGVQHLSQTVWCMAMVGADEDRKKVQLSMYNLMRRIIAKMILERRAGRLGGWDWSHIPVLVTNAGSNYTGYQFTLYFNEVTDLSMEQFGELWQ